MTGTCPHENTVPVEVGGHWGTAIEVVARMCVDCLDRLPVEWGCTDCDWVEAHRRISESSPQLVLAQRCPKHRRNA